MNKIWLVIQREYLTRVKNKTFILTTLLTPVALLLFFVAVGFVMSTGSDKEKNIAISDPLGILGGQFDTKGSLKFTFSDKSLDVLKQEYKDQQYNGILELLPMKDSLSSTYVLNYHSDDQLGLDENRRISSGIEDKIRVFKLRKLSLDEVTLKSIDTEVTIDPKNILTEKKVTSITTSVSAAIGAIVGYAMFFIILLYGSQVMRSVMEEKINRIVEVLISSVRPFDLMMGKVIGVGLVGLTQIAIWLILIPLITIIGTTIIGINLDDMQMATMPGSPDLAETQSMVINVLNELKQMNWWKIIPITLFYFIMGYFLYSALFAAIGSAVGEDINEAQSLTIPVMMPLMFSFYIGISAMSAPDSTLAVWASIFPFSSSIVMPVRLPFDPPWWQIIVSMISLVIFSIALVWLASRIYRVGILMYGKKASFKELSKWIFYKD